MKGRPETAGGNPTRRRRAVGFLKEAILLLPRIVQLLYRLLRDPRVSKADKVLVGALIAYIASPLDIVPDFIPLAGQVDDLFAAALVLLRLIGNSGEDVVEDHWSGPPDLLPWIHNVARFSTLLLPERVTRAVSAKFGT